MTPMSAFGDVAAWLTDPDNWHGPAGIPVRTWEHLVLSGISLAVVCAMALPLALWLGHIGKGGALAINVTNIGRAVPVFAVLVLLAIGPLGLGATATIVALILFGIPPVLTNAYVGMREVDRDTVEAARGMGMTGWQTLRRVELPLALPIILAGVRVAAVMVIGIAAIAAQISAGGLGTLLFMGIQLGRDDMIWAGAIMVGLLALTVNGGMLLLEKLLVRTPR
jgi:osmoprotectant transport system permease protein